MNNKVLYDKEDEELINQYKWYKPRLYHPRSKTMYVTGYKDGKKVLMHRLVMHSPKGNIDHINGNGLDNRKINLRVVTRSQNGANNDKYKNNTSGYKGVSWHKKRKVWQASLSHNGHTVFIGRFNNPIEAAVAYDKKSVELFGDYSKHNF